MTAIVSDSQPDGSIGRPVQRVGVEVGEIGDVKQYFEVRHSPSHSQVITDARITIVEAFGYVVGRDKRGQDDDTQKPRIAFGHFSHAEQSTKYSIEFSKNLISRASIFAASANWFMDFKSNVKRLDFINKSQIEANVASFLMELWYAAHNSLITFDEHMKILTALGPNFKESFSGIPVFDLYPGGFERMIDLYDFDGLTESDKKKYNLFNWLHVRLEAAHAVISRTELTTQGAEVDVRYRGGLGLDPLNEGETQVLDVKGAILEVLERLRSGQQLVVTKEIPSGPSVWSATVLEGILDEYDLENADSQILMLLRDLDPRSLNHSIQRFIDFFNSKNIEFEIEIEMIEGTKSGQKSPMVKLKAKNLEINLVKKDASKDNGDPHAHTKVDVTAGLGVEDYFADEKFIKFIEFIADSMSEGAVSYIGQFMKGYPDQAALEGVQDWRLITRSMEQVNQIMTKIAPKLGVQYYIFPTPRAEKTQMIIMLRKPYADSEEAQAAKLLFSTEMY